jgi:hypothetical protein
VRRATAMIDGYEEEIRLRNISVTGALIECRRPLAPGTQLTIDIVGVGPASGTVRWAGNGKCGIQFDRQFDLARLAPKKVKLNEVTMLQPYYIERRQVQR